MSEPNQPLAGVVLCGGNSRRMGHSKALLPFGNETMLQRVIRIMSQVTSPVIAVKADSQHLPELPDHLLITQDRKPEQGPLEGIRMGLRALEQHDDNTLPNAAAYVTSCDVPLLQPEFVQAVASRLGNAEAAVVVEDGFRHPLAAVYRTSVIPVIDRLLDAGQQRPLFLFEQVETVLIPAQDLLLADPKLSSLLNLNQPKDYLAALKQAELKPDPNLLAQFDLLDDSSF